MISTQSKELSGCKLENTHIRKNLFGFTRFELNLQRYVIFLFSNYNIILVLRGFANHADVILLCTTYKSANIYIYLVYEEAFLDVKCKKP